MAPEQQRFLSEDEIERGRPTPQQAAAALIGLAASFVVSGALIWRVWSVL